MTTKKPDKIRTHSRYEMKKRTYKKYVKCHCGTPIILVNDSWTTCPTCESQFKGGYGMSQPNGQGKPWPTPLKRFFRPGDTDSYGAGNELNQSVFNFGRHTKKLFKEIEELGGKVRIYYEMCTDGRKRPSSFNIEYWGNNFDMKGGLYLNIYPENRSNRVINEHINYFLEDLRSIAAFKDKHGIDRDNTWDKLKGVDENGKTIYWKPENWDSSSEVCVESRMEYSY